MFWLPLRFGVQALKDGRFVNWGFRLWFVSDLKSAVVSGFWVVGEFWGFRIRAFVV